MQNRKLNFEPTAVPTAAGNLFNPGAAGTGAVGYTQPAPYALITGATLTNRTNAGIAVTLYKGATGASTAGTEWKFAAVTVPANGSLYAPIGAGGARFDTGDYLTGVAASAGVVLTLEGEVGLSG